MSGKSTRLVPPDCVTIPKKFCCNLVDWIVIRTSADQSMFHVMMQSTACEIHEQVPPCHSHAYMQIANCAPENTRATTEYLGTCGTHKRVDLAIPYQMSSRLAPIADDCLHKHFKQACRYPRIVLAVCVD